LPLSKPIIKRHQEETIGIACWLKMSKNVAYAILEVNNNTSPNTTINS
jgi:hypothetical protein